MARALSTFLVCSQAYLIALAVPLDTKMTLLSRSQALQNITMAVVVMDIATCGRHEPL